MPILFKGALDLLITLILDSHISPCCHAELVEAYSKILGKIMMFYNPKVNGEIRLISRYKNQRFSLEMTNFKIR